MRKDADQLVGVAGETRTRSQLMADLLVERVTGQRAATDVGVTLNLIMTDQALAGDGSGGEEPAHLIGGGTVPAVWARALLLDPSGDTEMFLRRLYTCPKTGQLIAMESTARYFPAKMRLFMVLRDQICRTPWCDAPIRHADHVIAAGRGGPTSIKYGRGLCEACNYTNEAPGWQARVDHDDGAIITTTPTGHEYRSEVPRPPGAPPGSGPGRTQNHGSRRRRRRPRRRAPMVPTD